METLADAISKLDTNLDKCDNNNSTFSKSSNGHHIENGTHNRNDSFSSELSNVYDFASNNTETVSECESRPAHRPQPDAVSSGDDSSLSLKGGNQLLEESPTDVVTKLGRSNADRILESNKMPSLPLKHPAVTSLSNGTGTAKSRVARSPFTSPPLESIPVEEVTIPADANVSSFTCDQIANFLRCFNVEDRIVSHLHRKQVDGKRFSRLKDSELENLGMKNPAIVFFRDKSNVKTVKKKNLFIL